MSVFTPVRRVRDPLGRDWEIYAFRVRLRHRDPPSDSWLEYTRLSALGSVWWLMAQVPRLFLRVFVDFPVAAVHAIGSDEWTIEAVTWIPHRQSFTWTTSLEYRGQVLAQVEAGLAQGDIPRPRNATYIGAQGLA